MDTRNATGHVDAYVGKRGTTFYAKLRLPDGSQKRVKLGKLWTEKGRPPAGYLTRKQAESRCRDLVTDAGRGILTADKKSGVMFEQAAQEWIAYLRDDKRRKHSTIGSYENMLNSSLLEEFEGKAIEKISSVEIERYRARLIGDGLSPSTVNKKVVALNGIFKLAKRRHGLALNPCETVERQPIKASGQYTAYEPAQVVKLAASAPEPYGTLFLVAGFSGLRLGELRALRWEHIDFKQRTIAVEKNYVGGVEYLPKSSKVRSVPLISEASKALLALRADTELDQPEDLVFPSPTGGWLDDSKTRKVFTKAIVKAKVPAYRFHDLRHTFATLMIRALPIHDVQRIMGHEDIQTTMRYLHSKPMPQQTDALDGLVAEALKPDLQLVDDEGEKAA